MSFWPCYYSASLHKSWFCKTNHLQYLLIDVFLLSFFICNIAVFVNYLMNTWIEWSLKGISFLNFSVTVYYRSGRVNLNLCIINREYFRLIVKTLINYVLSSSLVSIFHPIFRFFDTALLRKSMNFLFVSAIHTMVLIFPILRKNSKFCSF